MPDFLITDGNPAGRMLAQTMNRSPAGNQITFPIKAALDCGFASKDNLHRAKTSCVKAVCFDIKRGRKMAEMCRSYYLYNRLQRFRAGVKSRVHWLKHSFGLWRQPLKGLRPSKNIVVLDHRGQSADLESPAGHYINKP